MSSNLRVVGETEVATETAPEPKTEKPSSESSAASRHMIEILGEIRKILSARAGALIAMIAAFSLTAAAMSRDSMMGLVTAVSFDALVFIPIAYIAYCRKNGQ